MLKYPAEKYPKISVITPVLNRVGTIEKSIRSLLDQNYPNVEFLVLDAASTDGTLEILNKYKDKIDYLKSAKDGGANAAANEGIEKATGDVISFLASDDWFEPNSLIRVGEAFIETPDADIVNVLGRVVNISKDGEMKVGHVSVKEDMPIYKGHVKILHPNCRFFKRELFKKYGLIEERINGEMTFAPDYEFITRFSLYNPKNVTLDFIGYTYLAHEGSLTYNSNKYTKLKLGDQNVFYIENFLQKYTHLMDAGMIKKTQKKLKNMVLRKVVKKFGS